MLENPNMGSEKHFVAWWDKYLLATYTKNIGRKRIAHVFLSGADAYALRCSNLHEGIGETLNQRARDALERFHFVTPRGNWIIHRNQSGKSLQLQIDIFCREICDGVSRWIDDTKNDAGVASRSAALLTVHDTSAGFDLGFLKIWGSQTNR